jgi:TonB-dependent SusC/RagA subfamily outer membrane receptor
MILWMMWAVAATTLLALSGLTVERILRSRGRQTRFAWVAVLAGATGLQVWSWWNPAPGPIVVRGGASGGAGVGLEALLSQTTPAVSSALTSWLSQWDAVAIGVWLLGTVVVSSMIGVGLARLMRRTQGWASASVDGEEVLLSDGFGPALVGFLTPRIVMPRWALALDREQRRLALLHESEHRAAHDTLLLLLGSVAVATAPWNPALWWTVARLRQAVELDCDQRVLSSGASRSLYGELLIDLSTRSMAAPFPVAAMARPVSLLERRLTMMTSDVRRVGPIRTVGLAAGAVLLTVAACETPAPSAIQDADVEAEANVPAVVVEVGGVPVASGETEPLVYLDGVRLPGVGRGALGDLNPDLIERIEVLKGPAATSLFGPEASNGVIQIYSKETPAESDGAPSQLRILDEAVERLEEPASEPSPESVVEFRRQLSSDGCSASESTPGCPVIYVDGELHGGSMADLGLDPDQIDRIEVTKSAEQQAIWIYLKNH